MATGIVESELDQASDRGRGGKMRKVERVFRAPQLLIDPFERGQIESVLVAEIMIDHPLVGVRAARDLIDAPAGETLGSELVLRGEKDRFTRAVGIAPVRRWWF